MADTLDELFRKFVEYDRLGDKADRVAFNGVKEKIGELIADQVVAERYGGVAAAGVLPRKNKVPIFDRVYELGDNRYLFEGAEEMIVIDAKFGTYPLSYSNLKNSYLVSVEDGVVTKTRAVQRAQVQQLDGNWIRYRIKEQAAAEKAAGRARSGLDLSDKLDAAVKNDKLHVLEVRTREVQIENGVVTDIEVDLTNHTERVRQELRSGRRLTDSTTATARRETIASIQLDQTALRLTAAKDIAKADKAALDAAKRARDKTQTALTKANEAADVSPGVRGTKRKSADQLKDIHADRRQAILDARVELERAETKYKEAKKVAQASEAAVAEKQTAVEAHKVAKAEASKAHEAAQSARKEAQRKEILDRSKETKTSDPHTAKDAASAKETKPGTHAETKVEKTAGTTADDAALKAERAVAADARASHVVNASQRATGSTGTAARLGTQGEKAANRLAEVAAKGADAVKVAGELAEVGRASRLRSIGRFALKGGRIVKNVGKYVLGVFELFNPILDIMMAAELSVSAVDALFAWMDRERINDREEWKRIALFLSSEKQGINMPPFRTPYIFGRGSNASAETQNALQGLRGPNVTFVDWLKKWATDKSWSGFVYATASIRMERQYLYDNDKQPYRYTYWPKSELTIALSVRPPPNRRIEGATRTIGEALPENLRTAGHEYVSNTPELSLPVEATMLDITYTYVAPALTPFDYMIAMTNDLLCEVISFISRYDETVFAGMNDQVVMGSTQLNIFANYNAPEPLDGPRVSWCIIRLRLIMTLLSTHLEQPGDTRPEISQKLNVGYGRRLQLLRTLSGNLFLELAQQFARLIKKNANPRLLSATRDKSLDYIDQQYLYDYAMDLRADAERAFNSCKNEVTGLEYSYTGKSS